MGSVSRGRWRRGVWGALTPTNGMASWAWLLAAVLLSLLTVSVARPPLTATKEEEATLEPEGKQQGMGRDRKVEPGRWSGGKNHLFGLFLESRCKSVKFVSPLKPDSRVLINFCILSLEFLSLSNLNINE